MYPTPKNFDDLPLTLWVEIMPIHARLPREFIKIKHENETVNVRQWSYIDMNDLPNVTFRLFNTGTTMIKICKIGNEPGNFPLSKCWWLKEDTERLNEIEMFKTFANDLTSFKYPDMVTMQKVQSILNKWMKQDKSNFASEPDLHSATDRPEDPDDTLSFTLFRDHPDSHLTIGTLQSSKQYLNSIMFSKI